MFNGLISVDGSLFLIIFYYVGVIAAISLAVFGVVKFIKKQKVKKNRSNHIPSEKV